MDTIITRERETWVGSNEYHANCGGWLFDYFPRGREIVFWFLTHEGENRLRLVQPYSPKGYVEGKDPARIEGLRRAMEQTRSFRMGDTVLKPMPLK